MKSSNMLFKYYPPTIYSFKNIQDHVLFCQHYSNFNDPFEFWSKTRKGIPDNVEEPARFLDAIKEWGFTSDQVELVIDDYEEYFESLAVGQPDFPFLFNATRIACFGSDPLNLLLWSHYADGLRGFCVVFDPDVLVKADQNCSITTVDYVTEPPAIDSFVYSVAYDQYDYHLMAIEETTPTNIGEIEAYQKAADDAYGKMESIWHKAFATKPLEWEYEREKRLLVHTRDEGNDPLFLKFPVSAVKEIILGERMPENFRNKLEETISKTYRDIPIKIAKRSKDNYKIILE